MSHQQSRQVLLLLVCSISLEMKYSQFLGENVPGGVQLFSGDWTKAERLLVGIGSAIFSSLWLANAACTASVWMSR